MKWYERIVARSRDALLMTDSNPCARIGCLERVNHWREFDRFELVECVQCHRFDVTVGEFVDDPDDLDEPERCVDCVDGKHVRVHKHAPVKHQLRYLYILKLDSGKFYVGQTNDMEMRMKEHKEGLTKSTKGKNPQLCYFEDWFGDRKGLNECEDNMTKLAARNPRAIRRMVNHWQRPYRLLNFDV